jgi:hypothetical protein
MPIAGAGKAPGALVGKSCSNNNNGMCVIKVRARFNPLDEGDPEDEKECVIRIRDAMVFAQGTRGVRWQLNTQSAGFKFVDRGVVIDDGGTHFETPQIVQEGVRSLLC